MRRVEEEKKGVSSGFTLNKNGLLLQFVILRWGWQWVSFLFPLILYSNPAAPSFALAAMIPFLLILRERERDLKFQRQSKNVTAFNVNYQGAPMPLLNPLLSGA